MALEAFPTADKRSALANMPKVAGFLRQAGPEGLELLQELYRKWKKDPDVEHFTFGQGEGPIKTWRGNEGAAGPYNDIEDALDRQLAGEPADVDPVFSRVWDDPEARISTGHTHPGRDPGSFSPPDLAVMNNIANRPNPGEQFVLQPAAESYEGIRILDRDLINPTPVTAPAGYGPRTPLETALSDLDRPLGELEWPNPDLAKELGLRYRNPNAYEKYTGRDNRLKNRFMLRDLGEQDRIDYILNEPKRRADLFDRLYEDYLKLKAPY